MLFIIIFIIKFTIAANDNFFKLSPLWLGLGLGIRHSRLSLVPQREALYCGGRQS